MVGAGGHAHEALAVGRIEIHASLLPDNRKRGTHVSMSDTAVLVIDMPRCSTYRPGCVTLCKAYFTPFAESPMTSPGEQRRRLECDLTQGPHAALCSRLSGVCLPVLPGFSQFREFLPELLYVLRAHPGVSA